MVVVPGDDVQARINANPAGTTFCFAAGKYRFSSALTPKSNDIFDGGGAAIFDGAKDISSLLVPSGSVWVASGQTQSLSYGGVPCESAKPLCQQADDVFFDGGPLIRVGSVAAVGAGKFYFDQAADKIYIGNNPAGHVVEASVAAEAFHGMGTGTDGVIWRSLIVQHFGLHGIQCRGLLDKVDHSTIRWNHGDGLQDCPKVVYSELRANGKDGYVFGGSIGNSQGPYLFDHNTVADNNYAGFDPGWEAGGAKFMQMAHLTVTNNIVTGNDGVGLWTDWGNQFVTYDSNTIANNTSSGISHEASYDATISNNTLTANGSSCSSTLCDSGIMMNDSQNVAIYGNTLIDNQNGIGLTQTDRGSTGLGPLVTQNDSIHDNWITHSGRTGLVQWVNDGSYYTGRNNHFIHNTYVVCSDPTSFIWKDPSNPNSYAPVIWSQWRSDGNDTTGSYGCS